MRQPVRVPDRTSKDGLGGGIEAELGSARRGDDDQSGPAVAGDQLRVGGGDALGEQARPVGVHHAGHRLLQILDDKGHARERARRQPGGHVIEGLFGARLGDGVDLSRPLCHHIDRGLDDLPSRQLASANGVGDRHRIHPEKVVSLPRTQQQFQLVATYSDGSVRDVSRTGIFNVNIERVAKVHRELGKVAGIQAQTKEPRKTA